MVLNHDAQFAVVAAVGPGRKPVHDFLLQHEMHVLDAVNLVDQMKNQRRGNVIRQIAHNTQLFTGRD